MTKTRPSDVPLPPIHEELLTRLEACRVARISLSSFDRAVKEGRIVVRRNGTRILVSRGELDRFIEALPSERKHSTRGQRIPVRPGD